MLNKDKTFSIDLSIFAGKVSDMAAGNLPPGVSPDCTDMFFGGQYTATRPALIHALDSALGEGDVLSHADYPLPTGQTETVMLYSDDGSLWTKNVQTSDTNQVGSVTPGARFKSIAAFNKFFMAFRPPIGGSLPNLSGCDVPLYLNTLGHLRPVTQDAPGGGFTVSGVTIAPEDLVTPGAWITGPDITSVVLGGQKTIKVPVPNKGITEITEYTNATITLDAVVTLAKGQIVQLFNLTWANPHGPQWANGIPVAAAVTSSTTFVINISPVTQNNSADGGTFAVQASSAQSLTRQNNIVTAFLDDTSPMSPTEIQPGWYVSLVDTEAEATAQLPDGTVPFTANELFQAIFPSSSGSGAPIGLLSGTQVFWNRWPENTPSYPGVPEPSGAYTWTYPGDGGNDPYQPSVNNGQPNAGVFLLEDDQSLLFNLEPSGFIPGFSFSNQSTKDNGGVAVPRVHANGTYAGTFNNIPTQPSFHGEGNNFDLSAFGAFTVTQAGNITFQVSRSDGILIGIKGATRVSGPQHTNITSTPQTVTAIKGYDLVYYNNDSGNGGTVDTFVVNFPAPGVYEFEMDMRHWTSSRMWFDLVYVDGGVNKVILPTLGPGSATVQGDGVGNIHVTTPIAVEALPIGAWLYLTLNNPAPANVINWTISTDGTALIQLAANSGVVFTVGEQILLNGFQGSGQPTGWNGQTVEITAANPDSATYQFAWSGPAAGGSSTTGTATPVGQQYPTGWVQVTQVISPTEFVYFAVGNTQTLKSQGVVYDYFGSLNTQQSLTPSLTPGLSSAISADTQASNSGIVQGFQVLSVDTTSTPNKITWYQAGFNDSYTGTHTLQVQPQSQIAGGPRNLVMFNINEDGGATPASYPLYVQLNGGTEFAKVTLPLGPPGTVARALAWTPAYGSLYFALAPGQVPATAGNAPVISLGTIVYDNTTINTIMDFSDASLLQGICVGPVTSDNNAALTSDFGDLTSTIVLPPCVGVLKYNEQLAWWGELNCLPNHSMINMGFDGNYDGNTTLGDDAQPLGWDNQTTYNSITPDGEGFLSLSADGTGFAYTLTGTTGTLHYVIYSPSAGVLANVSFPMANFTTTNAWYSANFSAAMPASIPPDTVVYLYVSGGSNNCMISQSFYQDYYGTPIGLPKRTYIMRFQAVQSSSNTLIDNLEFIDAEQPVLNTQIRLSYPDNEFGYDNQNGFIVGLDTTDFIAGCFLQRQYLYAVTDGIGELHTILSSGPLPSEWDVSIHAKECACAGPDAVTTARSTSWWMGRHGVQIFAGDQPKKISQHVAQDFEQTNWSAATNSCMAADTVQRVVYMGFPTGDNTDNSMTYSMNTRLADNEYNVPDPVHVSQYNGRIISTDLSEKWSPITVPVNSMCMSTQETPNGFAKVMTFGGGKQGPVSADVSATAQAASGNISIGLTPGNANDFVFVVTSAYRTSSGNTPAGWQYVSGGIYTTQVDSTNPLTFAASSPTPSEWTAVMASFAVNGSPAQTSNSLVDFGTAPLSQYHKTITVNEGDAIVWQFVSFSQFPPNFSISDNQGNLYAVYQNTRSFGGLQNTAYLAVALGCKAGSTTITFNISNFGDPTGSTGFQTFVFTYSGLSFPEGFGQLYLQDYWNYPPVTPSATQWNCLDADYGVINWNYMTYFFVSHDVEKQAQDALYRKLFGYMSVHVSGVGKLRIQPFVASLANPWPALAPFPLTLVDPGRDYNLGLNVLGERMSLNFSGVALGEGQGTAMLLTHLILSLREDNVFPVSGLW